MSSVISSGGVQASRRTESGVIRFSGGRCVLTGDADHHLPAAGQPAGRHRVPLGPPVRRGRPLHRRGDRQRVLRQLPGLVERDQPGAGQPAHRPAAETGQGQQGLLVLRVQLGGGDDRRVGQHPTGRGVAPGRRSGPGRTTGPGPGPGPAARAPGGCRRCAATAPRGPAAGGSPRRPARRTPPRPTADLPCRASSASSASRRSVSISTSSAAYVSQDSGSGRLDQSAAEWCFSRVKPSSCSVSAARPTRSKPASRAASSVSNSRRGRSPTSARQARSWLAACSTHSASPIASSSVLTGRAAAAGRSARCRRRPGAAAPGRPAGCSGSRRRARRPGRPGRCRPRSGPRPRPARPGVATGSGVPSRGRSAERAHRRSGGSARPPAAAGPTAGAVRLPAALRRADGAGVVRRSPANPSAPGDPVCAAGPACVGRVSRVHGGRTRETNPIAQVRSSTAGRDVRVDGGGKTTGKGKAIMTAGFGAEDGRPAGAEPADASGSMAGRPGPLPPRIEPQPGSTWSDAPTGRHGSGPTRPRTARRASVPPNTGQCGPAAYRVRRRRARRAPALRRPHPAPAPIRRPHPGFRA